MNLRGMHGQLYFSHLESRRHLNKLNTSLLSDILLHFAAQPLTHRCKTAGYSFSVSLKTDRCPLSGQERPEPAVSSQLLVPAAEPGEEGEQRPRHTERHLPQQRHHEVHADQ